MGRTLGKGISAKVKLGVSEYNAKYAMKIFRKDNPILQHFSFDHLKEEIRMINKLDHKHVIKYFKFKENATMIDKDGRPVEVAYIAQELIINGEFYDYVKNSGPFSERIARYYFNQILQGVQHIHEKGFCHRDLKLENMMLDNLFNIKIIDFGFACPLNGKNIRDAVGTQGYIAPEILTNKSYDGRKADIFSLGVILFILYSGFPPFYKKELQQDDPCYQMLAENKINKFWKTHSMMKKKEYYSAEFKDLVTNMLRFDPNLRFNFNNIVNHPWMT